MKRVAPTDTALVLQGVTQRFGGLAALNDVSFEVPTGTVQGVIGPNGAGKTTLLNILSGLQKPTLGKISVHGHNVNSWAAHRLVVAGGVVRTFQTVRLFGSMSVREHLAIAGRRAHGSTAAGNRAAVEAAERLQLMHVLDTKASALAYGLQRRVELGRALASSPSILLLDEPAAGLNPSERDLLGNDLRSLAKEGVTVVLIEHHMDLVQSVCDQAVVLNFGEVIATGSIGDVMRDPVVLSAYLGPAEIGHL